MNKFESILNGFGALIGIAIVVMILVALTSCGTMRLTDDQVSHRNEIQYEINKVWNEYTYKTDSLWIEYHRKPRAAKKNNN